MMTSHSCIWRCTIAAWLFLGVAPHAESDQPTDLADLRKQIETLQKAAKFSEEFPLAEKASD